MISLSHSYTFQGKHQQIQFPTHQSQETMRITWSFNRSFKLRCSQLPPYGCLTKPPCLAGAATAWCVPFLSPVWPWGEEAATEGEERPESRTQSRWRTPWMTRWRQRHMTTSCGEGRIQGAGGPGQMCPKRWSHQDARRFVKNEKIVHEVWPTEVECKCYKWSRFFGEASQDGYSFNVYCNPPSRKIGWGGVPGAPAGCIPGHEIFFGVS